jgi:hypothetical protein
MNAITYDAVVRRDGEAGAWYMAISTARYHGAVTITGWPRTGYGDTPGTAIAALEQRLQELHKGACRPRRIVYDLEP